MQVGATCLSCHPPGFGDEAPTWSAAGTVFAGTDSDLCDGVEGVDVVFEGEDGEGVRVTTHEVGCFWTEEARKSEGQVSLEFDGRRVAMGQSLPVSPACGGCHTPGNAAGAPGDFYAP